MLEHSVNTHIHVFPNHQSYQQFSIFFLTDCRAKGRAKYFKKHAEAEDMIAASKELAN